MPAIFCASEPWRAGCPGASVGALAVSGARGGFCPELERACAALEADLRSRFGSRDEIKQTPQVQAYAAWLRQFKKTYHVAAQAESVALKGRGVPRVSPLVACMFLAELDSLLLTAGHDRDRLAGPVTVGLATGVETMLDMRGESKTLKSGDMYMADEERVISNIVYGPERETAITPETASALFTVYAPPGVSPEAVAKHLAGLRDLIGLCSPGCVVDLLEVFSARAG